jgi:hypothetical protein
LSTLLFGPQTKALTDQIAQLIAQRGLVIEYRYGIAGSLKGDCKHQVVFAHEIAVDRALSDTGMGCDSIETHLGNPVGLKELSGYVQQSFPCAHALRARRCLADLF